jgi:hypothetical protein
MEETMRRRLIRQSKLFDNLDQVPVQSLREEERHAVILLLTEWMQALAKSIDAEAKDEQDQR